MKLTDLCKKYKIKASDIYPYGEFGAKIKAELTPCSTTKKHILVTSINPTLAGEGKTTVAIGLADALNHADKNSTIVCLRQPSIGPTLGMKGGATGGGKSSLVNADYINLGLNGDFYLIETINNLIATIIDNHIYHGNQLKIDPKTISWKRVIDLNDRSLRHFNLEINKDVNYNTGFDITAASEIMTIFCLSKTVEEMLNRIERIVVGQNTSGKNVTVGEFKINWNFIRNLIDQLMQPNVLSTKEDTLCLMHGGPFANIAHGCNSIITLNTASKYAKYVITEAGFGADLGCEKYINIVSQQYRWPDAVVVVVTIKSIMLHGTNENKLIALKEGLINLMVHINAIKGYGFNPIIAINQFDDDTSEQIEIVTNWAKEQKIAIATCSPYAEGKTSYKSLIKLVNKEINKRHYNLFSTYSRFDKLDSKLDLIIKKVYGLNTKYILSPTAALKFKQIQKLPYYVCMAKTQYSLSSDPTKLVYSPNDTIEINDFVILHGAEFIIPICGEIFRMPGLPKTPNVQKP